MPFSGPLDDRLAIRELIEAYADAVCRRDAAAWSATWAEDAEWSIPDVPGFGTPKGRAAIVSIWQEAMAHFPGLLFRAWPGSIEVTGDHAAVRSYTSETYDRDGRTFRDEGLYEDHCVKLDGQWLFASRTFRRLRSDAAPAG